MRILVLVTFSCITKHYTKLVLFHLFSFGDFLHVLWLLRTPFPSFSVQRDRFSLQVFRCLCHCSFESRLASATAEEKPSGIFMTFSNLQWAFLPALWLIWSGFSDFFLIVSGWQFPFHCVLRSKPEDSGGKKEESHYPYIGFS